MKVEESLNLTFNERPSPRILSPLVDTDVGATGEVIDVGYLLKPMLGQGFNIAVSCLLKTQYLIFMDYMSGINIIIESIMVL
ncbi:hypothetical protein Tco_0204789 [Tanacetum coccineum]